MKRILLAVVFLLVYGCATHNTIRPPTLNFDLNAQSNKISENDVECIVKAYYQKSKLEQYFGHDLLEYGILPVHICLTNKSNSNIGIDTQFISIVDITGSSSSPKSIDQVCNKANKSYWRTAGWGVLFGVFGIIPSAINVSNTNKKIRSDYESRILQSGNLVAGGATDGILFFSVRKGLNTLSGMTLKIPLINRLTNEKTILSYSFSGMISYRKPSSTDVEEKDRKINYTDYAKKEIPKLENKIRIVMLDFDCPKGQENESSAITNLTLDTLYQIQCFDICTPDQIKQLLKETQLQMSGIKENVIKVGNLMSAQYILIGDMNKIGNEYWILIRVIDVETAKLIISDRLEYEGNLSEIQDTYLGFIKKLTLETLKYCNAKKDIGEI
ncbi:MAG: hypothetical protein H8E80_05920 [Desulfobacteraceae bacterium]|uniref:Curli production assembly/transport component CsgG n=1 Tax=Candidatus Desulfaltia bathyphila TaxID=2841697 RepID=A0A8J6N5X6_9BACT|nr:hypothetical protein [Candidatus Desulfaltia bathyphila]